MYTNKETDHVLLTNLDVCKVYASYQRVYDSSNSVNFKRRKLVPLKLSLAFPPLHQSRFPTEIEVTNLRVVVPRHLEWERYRTHCINRDPLLLEWITFDDNTNHRKSCLVRAFAFSSRIGMVPVADVLLMADV